MSIYDIKVKTVFGGEKSLEKYKGKMILVVNTASKCGFTPQFEGLEKLNQKFKEKGLVILGFPCNQFKMQDPGSDEEILNFCQVNYGVTFEMFSKIDVNGDNRHPLYKHMIEHAPKNKQKDVKWNFEKFLIDRNGEVIDRYHSLVTPEKIGKVIEKLILADSQ